MTWRDTLEVASKQNASYRKDKVPPSEVIGPELPQGPGLARGDSAGTRNVDSDRDAVQLCLPLAG